VGVEALGNCLWEIAAWSHARMLPRPCVPEAGGVEKGCTLALPRSPAPPTELKGA
jgi:hypothetical protein